MSLREQILSQLPTIDEAMDELSKPAEPEVEEDEIVAAIKRQLDVLEGTVVMIGNAWQMLTMQIGNLRAELALLDKPMAPAHQVAPRPSVDRTKSGAVVESTLPQERRLPGFCDHEDALIVDTSTGPVRVCPVCDA